jgi:type VI protein secretion system component VasK
MDKYQRRLRFLARRIGRERAPYCPLNGVLLLVPFDALETDEDASQIATLCRTDLQVLHDSARVRCPALVLVTDLETAPGYEALSACLDADRRTRLFGQELPLLPDLKTEELPRMVTTGLRHFGDALTHWLFRLFEVEKSASDPATERIAANSRLFELLGATRQREAGLERVLTRILAADPPLEFMVGGFYLAATGANPMRDQAFVPGVFQQLVQNQNAVSWTDEALVEEADYQRWTTYGYAALAIFCIVVAVIIYGRWQMLRG